MSWGGSNLAPQPDSFEAPGLFIGSEAVMADASTHVAIIGEKRRITMSWTWLTYSQLAALRAIYDAKASAANTLVLYDGRSYSVIGIQNGWQEGETENGAGAILYYSLKIVVREF